MNNGDILPVLAFFAAALIALLSLILRRRFRAARRGNDLEQIRTALAELAESLKPDRDVTPAMAGAPGVESSGNRPTVLALARDGARPEQIAAMLDIPQNEVALVLKLHQYTQAASA